MNKSCPAQSVSMPNRGDEELTRTSETLRRPDIQSSGPTKEGPMSNSRKTADGIVALFNASDDTIDMVQTLLTKSGDEQTLIWVTSRT